METDWEALREAGLPEGAPRAPRTGPLDAARLRSAVGSLSRELEREDRDRLATLAAWLRAFRRHWPEAFAATLGEDGARALAALAALPLDQNRVLKLRRIAVENLAARL